MRMSDWSSDVCSSDLSFTGSTRVGHLVLQASAAAGVKRVALELGGNAPFIVTADADLDQAVRVAVAAKFQTTGQDCCAVNRIYVHRRDRKSTRLNSSH